MGWMLLLFASYCRELETASLEWIGQRIPHISCDCHVSLTSADIGGEIAVYCFHLPTMTGAIEDLMETDVMRIDVLKRTSIGENFHGFVFSFYLHLCGNMIQARSNLNFADDPRKITEVNQQTQIWSLAYKSWNLKDQQIDWPINNPLFISSKYLSASKNHVIIRNVCTTMCPCPFVSFIVSTAVFHRTAKVYTFRYMPSGDAPPKALIRQLFRCIDFGIDISSLCLFDVYNRSNLIILYVHMCTHWCDFWQGGLPPRMTCSCQLKESWEV